MAASSGATSLLDRFRGSLMGAVVGDCAGAHLEHMEGQTMTAKQKAKVLFEDIIPSTGASRTGNQSEYTDDTAMTRSVADSLIEKRKLDIRDMAFRFEAEFRREPFRRYGMGIVNMFLSMRFEDEDDVFDPARRQFGGTGSYGNGGAMRVAPAALANFQKSLQDSEEMVADITRITHNHEHGILGAILQHHAVHTALHLPQPPPHREPPEPTQHQRHQRASRSRGPAETGEEGAVDREAFIEALLARLREFEENPVLVDYPPPRQLTPETAEGGEAKKKSLFHRFTRRFSAKRNREAANTSREPQQPLHTYCSKLEEMKRLLGRDANCEHVIDTLGHNIAAFQSVPIAVYCFLRCTRPVPDLKHITNPFERTIVYAVSMGGDTDTIASMAGAIAGAYYGASCIPEGWLQHCEGVDYARTQAEGLYEEFGPEEPTSDDNLEDSPPEDDDLYNVHALV